jgi:hypothetical protein
MNGSKSRDRPSEVGTHQTCLRAEPDAEPCLDPIADLARQLRQFVGRAAAPIRQRQRALRRTPPSARLSGVRVHADRRSCRRRYYDGYRAADQNAGVLAPPYCRDIADSPAADKRVSYRRVVNTDEFALVLPPPGGDVRTGEPADVVSNRAHIGQGHLRAIRGGSGSTGPRPGGG